MVKSTSGNPLSAAAVFAVLIAVASAVAAPEVPKGAIQVPLITTANFTAYYAQLSVGTPPQKVWLKIDTGSPTYSVQAKSNPACERADKPCDVFGTFDNETSSTSSYQAPGFFDQLSDFGTGDYLSDTVSIGGVAIEKGHFGHLLQYGFPDRIPMPAATILGLSLSCNTTTCGGQGPYLLPQLRETGAIDRMSVSIYHGPNQANATGSMLLGGYYDSAKVNGELFTVNMTDPLNPALSNGQTNSANVTAVKINVDGNMTTQMFGEKNVGVPVLLDNGVANWYLPTQLATPIYASLGGILNGGFNPRSQVQPIDCRYTDPSIARGSVIVGFASSSTPRQIEIPLSSLVTEFSDNNCGTFVYERGDETVSIFGDGFLRGVYAIWDLEAWTISMGAVKVTEEVKYERIPVV